MARNTDQGIVNVAVTIRYMTFNTLLDVFDFTAEQIILFNELFINNIKENIDNSSVEESVSKFVKKIPSRSMIKLTRGKVTSTIGTDLIKLFNLDFGIISIVLVDHFNFTEDMLNKFYDKIIYYIDSYDKNYLNNNMIIDIFKDELNIDIKTV